jgi:hypothetical protein
MHADLCRLARQPDLETLSNPYTDSWILRSSPEQNVNTFLAGIAIETPELLLPVRLTGKHAVVDAAGMASCRSLLFLFITACPG